jgi:DHA2 family multidrug resistance protein
MYNWRWVFYVNLPFGILAIAGLLVFMPAVPARPRLKFSWSGFAVLALGVGAMQMMLDRGQKLDWFSSREIMVEAVLAGLGFYLFAVHMFTADKPFLPPALFKDRNFVAGILMVFCVSSVLLATSALLAPYLQNLAGYPVYDTGIALAPRGFGTMASMFLASRLAQWFDQRKIMAVGLLILGWALHAMSAWTPDITEGQMMFTLIVQGFSIGLVFNPMTVMAYTTLAPSLRGEATSMQSLARNIGSAIGISITSFTLTRSVQTSHADIVAGITPFDRVLQGNDAVQHMLNPATRHGAVLLDQMVTHQAQIIAYNNDFRMMMLTIVPPLLLLFLMRKHERPAVAAGD